MRRIASVLAALAVLMFAPLPSSLASGSGVISVKCAFSHRNNDDPIVHFADPGASHTHDYYGNESVDAFSTYRSMRAASSNCAAPSDTAGYWIPALVAPDGSYVTADHMNAYYRGDASTVVFPKDLRMVAGATVGTPAGSNEVFWSCGQVTDDVHSATVVDCPGDQLTATVGFPACWDGVVTHMNDTAHLTYDPGCKNGIELPHLTVNVKWDVQDAATAGYGLSSDASLGVSAGRSLHADFWNTWKQRVLAATVTRCLNGGLNCKDFTG